MDTKTIVNDGNVQTIRELVELGRKEVAIREIGMTQFGKFTVPVAILENGQEVHSLAEFIPPRPDRVRAEVHVNSVSSFVAYVSERINPDTRVFARALCSPYTFEAIMDYHPCSGDVPSWLTHRCVLTLTETDEWKTWMARNNQPMSQSEFAEFIETNLHDIIEPDGATILELALTLEAHQNTEFKGKLNLHNGDTSLIAEVNTEMKAGKSGEITIPREIKVRLSPFRGIPQQDVCARLRVVMRAPAVSFAYQLIRPQNVVNHVLDAAHDIITAETGVKIFSGYVKQ